MYLLVGDEDPVLFIENDQYVSIKYLSINKKWVAGGHELNDARYGYDPSEPEGSPYRFGNHSEMKRIKRISKEEAEEFIHNSINLEELNSLFK